MGLITRHIRHELIKETIKTLTDEEKLIELVKNDENIFEIRELATKQITSNDLLKQIIFDTSNTSYTKNNMDIRLIAVKQITDEETLQEIVKNYYDKTIDTKYDLNVVKKATEQISDEDILMDIAKSKYDEEVITIAAERINEEYEPDISQLRMDCDDDIKVKRMHAVDKINDDDILLEIAMNGKYLDVREKALNKIKTKDETVLILETLIQKEKEYHKAINEFITADEENESDKQDIIDKASNLEVEYKRAGNPKKEKFYNEQSKLFKNK